MTFTIYFLVVGIFIQNQAQANSQSLNCHGRNSKVEIVRADSGLCILKTKLVNQNSNHKEEITYQPYKCQIQSAPNSYVSCPADETNCYAIKGSPGFYELKSIVTLGSDTYEYPTPRADGLTCE